MNLEELISKYLDGELSEEEDSILRQRLSDDDTARMKFDSSLNLHLAYREDAESIFPPEELADETEDMILMKIFAAVPDAKKKRNLLFANTPMLAAAIVFFMMTLVFKISDVSFNNGAHNLSINQSVNNNHFPTRSAVNNSSKTDINNISSKLKNNYSTSRIAQSKSDNADIAQSKSDNADIASSSQIENHSNFAVNNEAIAANIDTIAANIKTIAANNKNIAANNVSGVQDVKIKNPSLKQLILMAPRPLMTIERSNTEENNTSEGISSNNLGSSAIESFSSDETSTNKRNISTGSNVLPVRAYISKANTSEEQFAKLNAEFYSNNDVQVASFFGTDILSGGANSSKAAISNFSQSIAYVVTKSQRVGLEVGYTDFAYNQKAVVSRKHSSPNSYTGGVQNYESDYGAPSNYSYNIVLQQNEQLLWASVFYENTLLNGRNLSLIGRLGAGGSSDGALGYGRLFGQFKVFNGFFLTLGTEGRMFMASLPENGTNSIKLLSTASVIYGFQVKF